jgi:hypothetical protein
MPKRQTKIFEHHFSEIKKTFSELPQGRSEIFSERPWGRSD